MALDVNTCFEGERRLQDPIRDEFRDEIRYSHNQAQRPVPRAALQDVCQFAAERKDFFGVLVNDLPDFGQHQPAALAGEQKAVIDSRN